MPDLTQLGLFLTAALVLAITPGPGIFYVLTRSIRGGQREGIHSSFGTAVGGMVHVIAATLGLSAILANSAIAFLIVKYAGAAYLIYLGISTIRQRDKVPTLEKSTEEPSHNAFHQGITTEMLNPKTALFFLAFIPQFVNPAGNVALQFLLLGTISISFNTLADLVVATLAGPIGHQLKSSVKLQRRQQQVSGSMLIGLGLYVALADSE